MARNPDCGTKGLRKLDELSPRERQLMEMASAGLIDKQIAYELGITANTLRTYWDRIREKVGDSSRAGLVAAFTSSEVKKLSPGSAVLGECGLVIDVKTQLVDASEDVSQEHGFEPGSLHALEEYRQLIHPDDADAVISAINEIVSGRTAIAHVVCRCMACGHESRLSYMFHGRLGEGGTVEKICGYRLDSRDLPAQASGKFRVGFFERWMGEDDVYLDPEAMAITGAESSPASRTALLKHVLEEDRARIVRVEDELRESNGSRTEAEIRVDHGDGRVFMCKVVVRGMSHPDGRMKVYGTLTAQF